MKIITIAIGLEHKKLALNLAASVQGKHEINVISDQNFLPIEARLFKTIYPPIVKGKTDVETALMNKLHLEKFAPCVYLDADTVLFKPINFKKFENFAAIPLHDSIKYPYWADIDKVKSHFGIGKYVRHNTSFMYCGDKEKAELVFRIARDVYSKFKSGKVPYCAFRGTINDELCIDIALAQTDIKPTWNIPLYLPFIPFESEEHTLDNYYGISMAGEVKSLRIVNFVNKWVHYFCEKNMIEPYYYHAKIVSQKADLMPKKKIVPGKIGIGITTRNRPEKLNNLLNSLRCANGIERIVVVDDASDVENVAQYNMEGVSNLFRFSQNVGVAKAKNKCIELLDDMDFIVLLDDDVQLLDADSIKWLAMEHIRTQQHHFSLTYDKFSNGKRVGNEFIRTFDGLNSYSNPCGMILSYTRQCIELCGGMNTAYGLYGWEHVGLSMRIYNSGLNKEPFICPSDWMEWFSADDYMGDAVNDTVSEKRKHIQNNRPIYETEIKGFGWFPYKDTNIVLTCYLSGFDNQRNKVMTPNEDDVKALAESCERNKTTLLILTDCLRGKYASEYVKYRYVQHIGSPYMKRFVYVNEALSASYFKRFVMCDANDVVMLNSGVFEEINDIDLWVGSEEETLQIKWLKPQIEVLKKYDKELHTSKHRLYNCGLLGGGISAKVMVDYMAKFITDNNVDELCDMALFNYYIYCITNMDGICAIKAVTGEPFHTRFRAFDHKNQKCYFAHK